MFISDSVGAPGERAVKVNVAEEDGGEDHADEVNLCDPYLPSQNPVGFRTSERALDVNSKVRLSRRVGDLVACESASPDGGHPELFTLRSEQRLGGHESFIRSHRLAGSHGCYESTRPRELIVGDPPGVRVAAERGGSTRGDRAEELDRVMRLVLRKSQGLGTSVARCLDGDLGGVKDARQPISSVHLRKVGLLSVFLAIPLSLFSSTQV